jgi:hypothetical protein
MPEASMANRSSKWRFFSKDDGAALLMTLIALSLFSLLGLFMMLNASTGLQISDNFESQVQASYAALSGLNHARALLKGLSFDDLLKGPDGVYDPSASYKAQAGAFSFRNLFSLVVAQSLNVLDPSSELSLLPDDGIISTGFYGGVNGTPLIPLYGIAQTAPDPYGAGTIITSRYFVKISDNNGDVSEIAGDPDNNPFVDGDGIIIMRSIGVARTQSDATGTVRRNNSVAVFEARMKRYCTFDFGPALTVHGVEVSPSFGGAYEISGGESPAIGTIDANPSDGIYLDQTIRTAPLGIGSIQGGGLLNPSVQDISGQIASNSEKLLRLRPSYLWNLTRSLAPQFADYYFSGNQIWSEQSAPYLGSYDVSRPWNAPGQDPKIIAVNGSLQLTGSISGGGLLIVTGDFSCSGPFIYSGLILVIGSGSLRISGSGMNIAGGVYVSSINNANGDFGFGTVELSIVGSNRIAANRNAVRMALGLLPASQIGFREIAGSDP